ELLGNISSSVSPMIAVSRLIKSTDKNAKVVFIGPCVAKKMEIKQADLEGSTDYAISFEELCALFDAKGIDVSKCEEYELNNASLFGRIFARSGGLSEAIKHVKEQYGIKADFKPVICDGITECEKALKMAKVDRLDGNFIEGMVCRGGCIGGPLSLHHGPKDKKEVDKYGQLAIEKGVKDSLRVFDIDKLNLIRNWEK
ncbi:MAG: 4Fe-4S dicluster protein, partial [Clostridia bacterium]|nr:4Fe-4S dicluster protein [Clostridia bacterium]